MKIEITSKFRALRRLRFEDTKRIMSPEMRPKSFGTFEKQAPGLNCFNVTVSGVTGLGERKDQSQVYSLVSSRNGKIFLEILKTTNFGGEFKRSKYK